MAFPADRTGWKKPRAKAITPAERESILAAIRAAPDELDNIAARFDLSRSTIEKMAPFARAAGWDYPFRDHRTVGEWS